VVARPLLEVAGPDLLAVAERLLALDRLLARNGRLSLLARPAREDLL